MSYSIKIFLILLGLCLAVGLAFLLTEPKGELVIILDQRHSDTFDQFFRYITFLGDGLWFAPLVILCLFVRYSWSAAFAILGLFQLMIIQGLKRGIFGGIPRPAEYFKDNYELQIVEGVDIHHFYSFPSGHTATAFAIAVMLVLLIRPGKLVSAGIFLVAALVGVSRIYLGQHFLEDVMMGAVLGTFSAFVVWLIFDKVKGKHPDWKFFNASLADVLARKGSRSD